VSDLLLRRVTEGRAGAEAPDDYDVIGHDGRVIGRIFKTAIPRTGTSRVWRVTDRESEDQGYEPTLEAAMQAFAKRASRDVRPRLEHTGCVRVATTPLAASEQAREGVSTSPATVLHDPGRGLPDPASLVGERTDGAIL
jgi:hypothetical protein